jgi:N-sulfoglucosamine sulfohydrolase
MQLPGVSINTVVLPEVSAVNRETNYLKMKEMNKLAYVFGLTSVLQISSCQEPMAAEKSVQETKKLNFILLLTDDQSYHLSMVGTPGIQTPNIDALAKKGVFFTKAYSAAASCSPCRSAILTGMYPHSNGHWRNTHTPVMSDPEVQFGRQSAKVDPVGVHEDLPTLIELLNEKGYKTGITSKFHLSPPWKYPYHHRYPTGFKPLSMYNAAADFLSKANDQPFFLQVNIDNTHRPFRAHINQSGWPEVSPSDVQVPPNWPDTKITGEDYAEYLSTVEHADAVVGEVLKALNESGQAGNTIIIYTSDQGFCYHRAKATTYDWGVHVPLSVTGPGIAAGIQTPELASHIDLTPTVLDFAGIAIPATVQGVSLRKLLEGKTKSSGHSYIFSQHNAHGPAPDEYYPSRTVTDGRFRYIRNLRNQIVPDYPIERFITDEAFANKPKGLAWLCLDATPGGNWGNRAFAEVIHNKDRFPVQYELLKSTFFRPKEELYDLENDPWEMNNLADVTDYMKTLNKLSQVLDEWMKKTNDDGDPRSIQRRTIK